MTATDRQHLCPTCGRPLDDDLEIAVEWDLPTTPASDQSTRVSCESSRLAAATDDEPYASIEITPRRS